MLQHCEDLIDGMRRRHKVYYCVAIRTDRSQVNDWVYRISAADRMEWLEMVDVDMVFGFRTV